MQEMQGKGNANRSVQVIAVQHETAQNSKKQGQIAKEETSCTFFFNNMKNKKNDRGKRGEKPLVGKEGKRYILL